MTVSETRRALQPKALRLWLGRQLAKMRRRIEQIRQPDRVLNRQLVGLTHGGRGQFMCIRCLHHYAAKERMERCLSIHTDARDAARIRSAYRAEVATLLAGLREVLRLDAGALAELAGTVPESIAAIEARRRWPEDAVMDRLVEMLTAAVTAFEPPLPAGFRPRVIPRRESSS